MSPVRAAREGMIFGLSALNRVYNLKQFLPKQSLETPYNKSIVAGLSSIISKQSGIEGVYI